MCVGESLISYKIQCYWESRSIISTRIAVPSAVKLHHGITERREFELRVPALRHFDFGSFSAPDTEGTFSIARISRVLLARSSEGEGFPFVRGTAAWFFFFLSEYISWINKSKVKFKASVVAILLNVKRRGNVWEEVFFFPFFFFFLFFFFFPYKKLYNRIT